MVDLRHAGTMVLYMNLLNMSVKTSASWSAHPLSTLPRMLFGPAAFGLPHVICGETQYLIIGRRDELPHNSVIVCLETCVEVIQRIWEGGITVTGRWCWPVVGDGLDAFLATYAEYRCCP